MTWVLVSAANTGPTWRVVSTPGNVSLGGSVRTARTLIGVPLQGPPGPQGSVGPMGPSGGAGLERTADVALSGHRCVRATSSTGVDYADSGTPSHRSTVLGITTGAAAMGVPITVLASGALIEPSWAWTPGLPIYAGANGLLTQTAPVAGWLRVLGFATSPTSMVVQLLPPFVLS